MQNKKLEAENYFTLGRYTEALKPAFEARKLLMYAYALVQIPEPGEFRALWDHSGTGLWPGDWTRSAHQIYDSGFNAIFSNMLWGGLAHYPSMVLPRSSIYTDYGDQIDQSVNACKLAGIETHVWKVNWNLSKAPVAFVDSMRAAARTQVDVWGNDIDWLCPSNPDNRQLEIDSMMEVVNWYDIDGIHLDYIRYPGNETCYCDGCRVRFESYRGSAVPVWPDDCYDGALAAEYRDWRVLQITSLVQRVHDEVKASKPTVKVSAAVFSSYPNCRTTVGQDWVDWIAKGYLDFVLPMDYTDNPYSFADIVAQQLALVAGRIPMYPGIGVTSSSSTLSIDKAIVQILETRKQETHGFILFSYNSSVGAEILPPLAMGTTYRMPDSVPLEGKRLVYFLMLISWGFVLYQQHRH
ncbi:MAG: hypothetical protein A2161_01830 [Candidatus Schekmanbacteria bacterium RBG_13_48_7]|uniref:Glycosyl hydrolase-like 10 domain-containing protein n=1 Tax=Candidatus Schekmanbacteria bacterium RBG_13_48_7 TaxID=1817878 RepID=A0A1F7RQY0_9BACT|nr:MAG: hypothetical protein A2161_01830 [Candidatus Schekmanbacteria bacterium RBG_13_48_7]